MSRLTELLRQARSVDPQLGADLEKEVQALTKRRTFGLVFERHQPEAVELPGREVRRGDKVRMLPPRGEVKPGDQRLWRAERIERTDGQRVAHLSELDVEEPETQAVDTDDLIVVAEFKDRVYPGLVETGRVERGGDKPFHTVINAENFHALEMLTYTHRHQVDAIYIDPPYNTGARDWKYNNDYVEGDDDYRHSKWLAMMDRRLRVARDLLKPERSVLIVTIDEKEYARLALLLGQRFPEATVQMVSIVMHPNGSTRTGELTRVNEYAYFCFFGDASPAAAAHPLRGSLDEPEVSSVRWERLMRGASGALRSDRPNLFYPVFVEAASRRIVAVGEPLPLDAPREAVRAPQGTEAVWPLSGDRIEKRWRVSHITLRDLVQRGLAKVGSFDRRNQRWSLSYLNRGQIERWERGDFTEEGRDVNGVVQLVAKKVQKRVAPTAWDHPAHSAGEHGSRLLGKVIPGRKFPFPKSLYAVEDCLRVAVGDNPDAVVLDFFAGSGTTAHAVMRLNRQDAGRRQSISVTNNEVSADEQRGLRKHGLRPGDPAWEVVGICDYVTKPRIAAAITGRTPDGEPVKGDYRFTDEFPMAKGFEESAAFFTLTYETPLAVRHHRSFERVAPMLWMRAGSRGRIITDLREDGWEVSEVYAVVENLDQLTDFVRVVEDREEVRTVFVITDDDAAFQMAVRDLPGRVTTVRLYSSYLENFALNAGGDF
nr:DNA methyltransferase [Ornithinimicrobium cryptoxanthini]